MKKLLKERFQELAGIKPLYEQPEGGSDYNMLRSFQRDELLDDLGDLISKYVKDPDDVNRELDKFDDGGFANMSDVVTSNLLDDDEYKEWEKKFQNVEGERNQYEKVAFVYTEQGGHFYGLDVYESKDQDQRSDKLKYDEANEWLKGVLEYIHEGDLIPRRYNSGLEDLDLIVARLEELGIEASHGDYMDVS